MTRDEYTKFEASFKNSPHVVLLGAGASCAAIPQGDRNGLKMALRQKSRGMTDRGAPPTKSCGNMWLE